MNRDFPKAKPDTPVRRLIEAMAEKKTPYVIVEEDGKLAGIVTPVQILKLVTKSVSGVYVGISGIQEEDDFIKSVVDEEIRNETRKLGRIFPINQVLMHVDRYHKAGKRVKYSIKAKIITGGGMFFAHDHAWDITKAAKGILQKLEREMIKKKEKRKTHKDSR
jgi:ribosome-associated translation inhibitor RaiA